MLRDVLACSGMFRNVPCSGFYQRPFESCETLLDFSEQDFILETVMRSYSRRLDSPKLNPYFDLRQITKLTTHPT